MYTNKTGIPMSLAVWLAHDDYDHNDDDKTISATAIIRPTKQLVLGTRVPVTEGQSDINMLIPSSMGTALHNDIEYVWKNHYKKAMHKLGYPDHIIDRVQINPESPKEDDLCIYLEQRSQRELDGFTISGKYDAVINGRVRDFKSTSVYSAINKSNHNKFILQGSIYRWLNEDKITDEHMAIDYIFTDWSAAQAKRDPKYPQQRCQELILPLLSVAETESYLRRKLNEYVTNLQLNEENMPACTSEELWRKPSVFKYYKNKAKMTKSTKNFENPTDAYSRLSQDGNVGIVVETKGQVVACKYCPAVSVCQQKDEYLANGTLTL